MYIALLCGDDTAQKRGVCNSPSVCQTVSLMVTVCGLGQTKDDEKHKNVETDCTCSIESNHDSKFMDDIGEIHLFFVKRLKLVVHRLAKYAVS